MRLVLPFKLLYFVLMFSFIVPPLPVLFLLFALLFAIAIAIAIALLFTTAIANAICLPTCYLVSAMLSLSFIIDLLCFLPTLCIPLHVVIICTLWLQLIYQCYALPPCFPHAILYHQHNFHLVYFLSRYCYSLWPFCHVLILDHATHMCTFSWNPTQHDSK